MNWIDFYNIETYYGLDMLLLASNMINIVQNLINWISMTLDILLNIKYK
jgi:hypothetical protein